MGQQVSSDQWDYRLFRDTEEEVMLELEASGPWQVKVRHGSGPQASEHSQTVENHLDLTPFLPERGEFFVAITPTNESQVKRVAFRFELPPQPLHVKSFLFFTILSVICWSALLGFLLPMKLTDAPADDEIAHPWLHRIVCYLLGLIVLLIIMDGHWWRAKDFDDQYALGPAAALARHGFDADRLFFRARVRPTFSAYEAPLQSVIPLQFASTSRWNTDNWRRWFDKYDRPNRFFAELIYLENTILALLTLLGTGFLVGRMGRVLGLDRTQALAATGITLLLLLHILDNVVSFSFTSALVWGAPAAAIWALSIGGKPRCIIAGLIAGAAVLAKETAVSVGFAIFFLLLLHLLKRQNWRKRLVEVLLYVASAVALPLIYFTLIIPGGFDNLLDLFREHSLQHSLYPKSYILLTPSEALKNVWQFGGVLPLVALIGFIRDRRRANVPTLGSVFFLLWTLGACSIFFSPYILPRFFNDFIPPLAYFCSLIIPRSSK